MGAYRLIIITHTSNNAGVQHTGASSMKYITTNDHGWARTSSTIEGAICHAIMFIYVGDKAKQDARETLKQGKPVTIIYGFKTVTIEPIATA